MGRASAVLCGFISTAVGLCFLWPVKVEFQINNKYFFSISEYRMKHTYTKKIIYWLSEIQTELKFFWLNVAALPLWVQLGVPITEIGE